MRLLTPEADATQRYHGRVMQHRVTGQVRGVLWTEQRVVFHAPENGSTFQRPHAKALAWLADAVDVTPAEDPNRLPTEVLLRRGAGAATVLAFTAPTIEAEVRLPGAAASPQES